MLFPFNSDTRFMAPKLQEYSAHMLPESRGVFQHGFTRDIQDKIGALQRGDFGGEDPSKMILDMQLEVLASLNRAQTSTGIPIREDLEAEVTSQIPMDTPLRNRLKRTPGSSTASSWEQQTSLGGGYGVSATVSSGTSSTSQTLSNVNGIQVGMSLYFATANAYAIVTALNTSTNVTTLATSVSTTTGESVFMGPHNQPGQNPVQAFFAETGAPANSNAVYAKITKSYKLMGTLFSITGLAMAAGATFDNQLAMEKAAAIKRLMLIEEFALINGVATSIEPPFGDGANALAFDGVINLTTTANGVPLPQIQTAVGALTTAHIDSQLTRQHNNGAMNPWILINAQEALSLVHLAEASGSLIRVMADSNSNTILGVHVTSYKHPVTGELVPILVSRFMPAGTILYGADQGPDGKPAIDVRVLPQVQLPQLAPNVNVQGYVAQEIAPAVASPQVYPGIVSVYEVLRMKNALVFCKDTGVTAV